MKAIKYLVMDVDGTLTDGKVYMSPSGEAMKAFNIKDGCGITNLLIPSQIIPIILTGRTSEIVTKRCLELGINNIQQGVKDKTTKLKEITNNFEYVAYIGDDINDLDIMLEVKKAGGLVGCPSDAAASVKSIADYISGVKGGDGAVREFIEWLLL